MSNLTLPLIFLIFGRSRVHPLEHHASHEPFLPSNKFHSNLALLPLDNWMLCLEFLIDSFEFRYIRLLSRRHYQNQCVFLRRRLSLLKIPNGTKIATSEIHQKSIAFTTLSGKSIRIAFRTLRSCHHHHRYGVVCGVNIISGLPFLSLHLREQDTWGEISMICIFDDVRVRTWTYSDSVHLANLNGADEWNLKKVGDIELSDLLKGKSVEVMRWFGEPRYLRIKRRDEYFDWKKCKKYSAIYAAHVVIMVVMCAIMLTTT